MKNVMVDIETLGQKAGSAILSIGAVKFDKTGILPDSAFYKTISIQSCLDVGLTIDASTFLWWMEQSDEARMSIVNGRKYPLEQVLSDFAYWFGRDSNIWGNGSIFDIGLLEAAYAAVKLKHPWKYWDVRCFRTVREENSWVGMPPFEGPKHNALADAVHQAKYLIKIWEETGRE